MPFRQSRPSATPTRTFPLQDLIDSSYYLSHMDVLKNIKDLDNCDSCGCLLPSDYGRACDGTFPSNAGVHWPEGALGRQFHCFRGALCKRCDDSLGPEHKCPGKGKKNYWLCKSCLAPPTCHEDVWGYGIEQPPNSLRSNCLWMSSVPRAPMRTIEPADAHNQAESQRQLEFDEAESRFARQGGREAVEGAGHWMQLFKQINLSKGAQQHIISGVHAINDARLLVKGETVELNLPRKVITLLGRGAPTRVLDKDVPVIHSKFCMESMRQTKRECSVVRSDVGTILQSMLLDTDSRPGSFLLERRGDRRRKYCDQDGNVLRGTEPFHGYRWDDLLDSIPDDGYLLALILTSDAVESTGHDRHPMSFSNANLAKDDGSGERRLRCFAMTGVVETRRPRGTKVAEALGWDQKAVKKVLQVRMFAENLVDLDVLATTGAYFWVSIYDGTYRRVKLYPRLFVWAADMAEQQAALGISSTYCANCYAYSWCTKHGAGTAGTPNRPHMNTSERGFCPTAQRRTALSSATRQQTAMHALRNKTQSQAIVVANELGVNPLVECSLYRLNHFIVLASGSFFGVDVLHTLRTGIVQKLVIILDASTLTYHRVTPTFKSTEDVRHEVDTRLGLMPHKYGSPSFREGFWAGNDIGTIKGEEVTFLLELLAFVILGDDLLIDNLNVRKQLLKITSNVLSFINEAYTPQWYTAEEDQAMDDRVKQLFASMHTVMDLLVVDDGGYVPEIKRGGDIPKFHAAGNLAADARKYGCNANVDTEAGERSQKLMKATDKFTNHNVAGTNEPLLQHVVSVTMDAARSEILEPQKRYRAVPSGNGQAFAYQSSHRHSLGFGPKWDTLVEDLGSSRAGPVVPEDIILQCVTAAIVSHISDVAVDLFVPASAAALQDQADIHFCSEVSVPCDDKHVSFYNFTAGHTIVTTMGTYVQLLVPLVVRKNVFETGGGTGHEAQCVVSTFVPVRPLKPMHPELEVPWIRRGPVHVMLVRDLVRRIHVPPVFGEAHRRVADGSTPHFVVNTLGDPYFAGPPDRLVFQNCRVGLCDGRLPRPVLQGTVVQCDTCGAPCAWF